jgi:hypothetical protein
MTLVSWSDIYRSGLKYRARDTLKDVLMISVVTCYVLKYANAGYLPNDLWFKCP